MSIFYSMNLENVAKSRPLCRPAFSSAKQALSCVALALGILAVPMIFSVLWPIESWRIYRGVPAHFGNYSHIGDVIAGGGADKMAMVCSFLQKKEPEDSYPHISTNEKLTLTREQIDH